MDARSTSSLPAALAPPALLFLLAGAIGWTVMSGRVAAFDAEVLVAVAQWARSFGLMPVALLATLLGDWPVRLLAMLVAVAFLLRSSRRIEAALLVVMVLAGSALISLLKDWAARPRPALVAPADHVESFAFPSGHAGNGAIVYLGAALLLGRGRPIWMIGAGALVLAIGLSRIVLGVHWPTDVLAGWCLGLGWVLLLRLAVSSQPR